MTGVEQAREVDSRFRQIEESFSRINRDVAKSFQMTEAIAAMFTHIHEETTNIAAISEENAASSQEISSTMTEQHTNIQALTLKMANIRQASEVLSGITK